MSLESSPLFALAHSWVAMMYTLQQGQRSVDSWTLDSSIGSLVGVKLGRVWGEIIFRCAKVNIEECAELEILLTALGTPKSGGNWWFNMCLFCSSSTSV